MARSVSSSSSSASAPGRDRASTRQRLIFIVVVAYAAVAALRATALRHPATWLAAGVSVLLVVRGTRPRPMAGEASGDQPRQLATFAFALTLASAFVPTRLALPATLAAVGAAVAVLAATRALARTSGPASVITKRGSVPWVLPLLAAVPAALAVVRLGFLAFEQTRLAEKVPAWEALAAALPPTLLFMAAVMRASAARLELGARERTRVAVLLALLFPLCGAVAVATTRAPLPSLMELVTAAEALALAWVLGHGDAVELARIARRALTLLVFLGPVCALGALMTFGDPAGAPGVTAATGGLVLALSLFIARLEPVFVPDQGRLLAATERAHEALFESESSEAVRVALERLRQASGPRGGSPELWMLSPPKVLTIDAAGYPHTRVAELPRTLLAVCASEPYGTLRTEALRALEVRRADLRPLLAWLSDRSAMAAVIVAAAGEPEGLLLVPGGARREPLSLEEVLALKRFADTLSAACQGESALSRSLGRERATADRAEQATDRVELLGHRVALDEGRNVAATTRLARAAHVGVYSTSIRMAYETLERRVHRGAPVVVVAPSGVDAVPYLAKAHLSGPRRARPLVVVDGTATAEHDPEAWKAPHASPLALADGGVLVLVDGAALPAEVQRLVARALLDKKCPWERPEPLEISLAFTCTRPPEALADEGELAPQLLARLGDAGVEPITFPRLQDRAEDLRAMVTDALAREGLRVRGRPVGLSDHAFGQLLEYAFPGEEPELFVLARRLVRSAEADVVSAEDVARVLGGAEATEPEK